MERHWTCCECEKQISERYFDLEERMCYECLDDDMAETIIEIKKSIQELHPQPIVVKENE
tara:strand:- start:233 stop:412 length:180 start_codon:yes stop_codon:yes gene_type:complete